MTALALSNIAASPSPDWRRMTAIGEAAVRLDVHPDHLARTCREKLQDIGLAFFGQHPGGGQPQWFVSRDYDPRLIPGPVGDDWREPDLSSYSQRQRNEALQRRACVEVWNTARTNWTGSTRQILDRVLSSLREKFTDLKISRSRLYAWSKVYRRPADTLKLIDIRGGNHRGKSSEVAWAAFKDLYLHANRPALRRCWMEVDRLAKENGWTWCSLSACNAQLNDRITIEQQTYHREPETWRTQLAPFIPQNVEAWGAGEVWISDHKQLDLICTFAGQKIRPWVTAWMDWRTRRVTGWVMSDNPNSSTILAALRHGLKDESNFGGPRRIWIDNGKDFSAWMFHGQTKTQRREKIKVAIDEAATFGIFKALNIEAHFAVPYNANGKARLERWFRTLETLCKTFATYTGESIETRPERLNEILESPRQIPSFEDVRTRLVDHIIGNNLRADHDLDDLVDNGVRLSPNEAFARWCDTRRIMADPAALDLLLALWHRPVPVTRKGVTINVQGRPLSFGQFDVALSPFKALRRQDRKPVLVSYDPHDLRSIRVYNPSMQFVCAAALNEMGGAHGDAISVEHVKQLNRDKARYTKSLKHQAEAGYTSVLTAEEHLAKIAADAGDVARAVAVAAEPPSMQIVRTPLDGQAKKPAREKMRQAVGSESIEFPNENPLDLLRRRQEARSPVDEIGDPFEQLRERNHGW